ncbi:hypothetical protein Aduo_017302 [Ancylostoma duodenale]
MRTSLRHRNNDSADTSIKPAANQAGWNAAGFAMHFHTGIVRFEWRRLVISAAAAAASLEFGQITAEVCFQK